MEPITVLFYLFSGVLLLAAFRVITAKSTVHAALYLVLAFFNAACLWMLLKAEFLSIALVLVYVGAVMVLFLFVVMMLDINTDQLRAGFWRRFPSIALVGLFIVFEMAVILRGGFYVTKPAASTDPITAKMPNAQALGYELFTSYLYPTQIAAVLLLVAIIAAIALTSRERKDSKAIDPSVQLKAKKSERLKVLSMAPVLPDSTASVASTAPSDAPKAPAAKGGA